jgi:molybdopterin synthase sulfur carrier subunit
MKVRVRFFASLREGLDREEELLELPAQVHDLAGLREHLRARGGPWHDLLDPARAVRGAVNQVMAADSTPLAAGDEVAFFPPVTGG